MNKNVQVLRYKFRHKSTCDCFFHLQDLTKDAIRRITNRPNRDIENASCFCSIYMQHLENWSLKMIHTLTGQKGGRPYLEVKFIIRKS